MNKYMNFKAFRTDVENALADVAKKYGVELKIEKITYDDYSFKAQLMGTRTDKDVQKERFEELLYLMNGFTKEDYLREFVANNKKYVITGFKPLNKYSVITKGSNGSSYAFAAPAVLKALGR